MSVRANIRTYAIGVYLLSGWTPWGVHLTESGGGRLILRGGRWIMCCGHALRRHEVERWLLAGLVVEGPADRLGHPTIIAGPRLSSWVSGAFHGLRARRWGQP